MYVLQRKHVLALTNNLRLNNELKKHDTYKHDSYALIEKQTLRTYCHNHKLELICLKTIVLQTNKNIKNVNCLQQTNTKCWNKEMKL